MRARDIAFIRKLCSLGLPGPTLAQSLLPALRKLIPAHSGAVFWVDEKGEMQELYAERLLPPQAMARYYERHYATRTAGFAQALPPSATNWSSTSRRTSHACTLSPPRSNERATPIPIAPRPITPTFLDIPFLYEQCFRR